MKKILSVMLAIMMLFGALSVSASAANEDILESWRDSTNTTMTIQGYEYTKTNHVILSFDFQSAKSYNTLPVYDTTINQFKWEQVTGQYLMLPGADGASLAVGSPVTLPLVTAPEGKQCTSWYCVETGQYYVAGKPFVIPEGTGGKIYNFRAELIPAEEEGDTMATVLGILMKVFGTIIGILFLDGNSASGIELMEKVLGGLF